MNMVCFTVYDVKAEAYLQPFFAQSNAVAMRMFGELVNDKNHNFGKYPQDYVLFRVGSFDQSSGTLGSMSAPFNLGVGTEFVRQPVDLK